MPLIQILTIIIIILFLIKVAKDAFYFLWLFQVKEYRLDRIKSHLRENVKLNLPDILTALAAFALLSVFFQTTAVFILIFFILLLGGLAPFYFLYSFFGLLFSIKRHSLKRPKPTFKILLILGLYLVLYIGFVILSADSIAKTVAIVYSTDFFILLSFFLLCLNALVPVFILVSIILITPFSNYQKKRIMQKARWKMESMKKVKTVGITGSFGKTSTKEFLYAILSQKYKVVKTSGNNNTNMGVANAILSDVSDKFDYFICEMGAYRIGEIEEICSLAKPFAGIITGINEQHVDLFGSIENTKRAKFELVQSLPEDGFAVISREAQKRRPKPGYKVKDVTLFSSDMAENMQINPDSVEFDYKNIHFTVNMLGKHYVGNLISTIIVCEKLGMNLEEIRDAVLKLEIRSDYLMQKLEGLHGSVFINDSYSANPDGVIAALEYLEDAYPDKKKILVFPGIIELGKNSEAVHEKIRRKTEAVCQFAYILQKEDGKPRKSRGECRFVFGKDFDKMKEEVEKRIDKNSVVLFEGRGAGVVMKKLLDANKK